MQVRYTFRMDLTSTASQVTELATSGAATAWLFVGNFIALIALTAGIFWFFARGGRNGIIPFLVSLYAGYALYVVFPFTGNILALGETGMLKAALSIGVYAALTAAPLILLRRVAGGKFGGLGFPVRLGLSFLGAAFLIAVAYRAFDAQAIYDLPDAVGRYFTDDYFFYWFVAPLVGLLAAVR